MPDRQPSDSGDFPLDRYLARLGLERAPPPDLAGLETLQRSQMRAIPFENLDVLLGRPIRLDPVSLTAKLIDSRRGGYCFELNGVFHQALVACGFEARPLLARVLAQRPPGQPGPRTHYLMLVTLDGRPWIADAGFGLALPHSPLPLEEGTEHAQIDTRLRLRRDDELGWVLQRAEDSGWADLYAFTLDRVYPADIEVANHFTSSYPDSPFRRFYFLARVLEGEARLSVLGAEGGIYRAGRFEPALPPGDGRGKRVWFQERLGIELDGDPDTLPL